MADTTTAATASTGVYTLIVSTGILSALFTQFLAGFRDWLKENSAKKNAAVYGATRLAIMLEKYALDCARAVEETRNNIGSGGHAGRAHGSVPELSEYPAEINWEALDASLMNRVLALPNQIDQSNGYIKSFVEYADSSYDYEDSYYECTYHCIQRGHQALKLADDLRTKYKIQDGSSLDEVWVM